MTMEITTPATNFAAPMIIDVPSWLRGSQRFQPAGNGGVAVKQKLDQRMRLGVRQVCRSELL